MGPPGAERASAEVFLTVEFARRAIAELERAVGTATSLRCKAKKIAY
jgi:hypothetical protein